MKRKENFVVVLHIFRSKRFGIINLNLFVRKSFNGIKMKDFSNKDLVTCLYW